MDKQEFFKLLENSIVDGIKRYYRNLVFIQDKNYLNHVKEILQLYLKINSKPSIAYAFHPWVKGAKDRLNEIRNLVDVLDIDYSSSDRYLGSTFDVVILDLIDNFEPNYIGRLIDLVRGGGIGILYTDNLIEHKLFRNSIIKNGNIRDVYEKRFLRKLNEHQGIFMIINSDYIAKPFNGEVKEKPSPQIPKKFSMPLELHKLCMSKDQNKVLESFNTIRGGGKKVFVITSARGRGKSAVTGLGLAGLISKIEKKKKFKVVVTAPSSTSISQLMLFLKKGLDALSIPYKSKDSIYGYPLSIEGSNFKVYYEIPEATLEDEGDLLVVDEAAAIGIGYIDSAIKTWKKVVLVTTVHGYEGSGKAFLRYLKRILTTRKVSVVWQELIKPLRYAEGDPVEKWLYDTLLLDAEPDEPPQNVSHVIYESANVEEIFNDDHKLRQIYGILVTAHYRNNPNDLMIMADGVHHKIKTLSTLDGKYIGVVQIAQEGDLPDSLIDLALKGGTFDGDLIPDRLIKHVRLRDFGKMKGWRIVRIAIVQELQDKGLGSTMLNMVEESAKEEGVDWVGSAFMGDARVLNFWIKNGYVPVHVSPKKNEKLGDYPVVVIKPISETAVKATFIASMILKDKILNTLHDIYFSMDPEIARIILNGIKVHKEINVNRIYVDKVLAFVQGVSPYESSADGIHMITLKYFWDAKRDWSLTPEQEIILIAKVLQGRPWRFTSSSLNSNRTTINELLYEAVAELLYRYYNLTPDSKGGLEIKNLDDEFHTNEL
ncbi:tRNA(Met) cytidine acetyltransferase TmcA [Sulfurisphaera ohwakuensis]|uniref:tRNA(Met) cytidine acetyltransferase TmcA n=1 Tax=Sulfurisphaera ohwakuensis TaxID=69656 RepID=A0A650CJT8_SULOH|nr:GNAT family N-acetyltransferase [Sulfurisphaera ohwakuensis]MBB5253923.1 tRNA(Met) cytidine acetyltransferase [Sulfurisphaera ohwakuensis]QGR17983.1 GNAT family N-acetyltransferase [Sulfurisphaera ohwakuensis]